MILWHASTTVYECAECWFTPTVVQVPNDTMGTLNRTTCHRHIDNTHRLAAAAAEAGAMACPPHRQWPAGIMISPLFKDSDALLLLLLLPQLDALHHVCRQRPGRVHLPQTWVAHEREAGNTKVCVVHIGQVLWPVRDASVLLILRGTRGRAVRGRGREGAWQ